MIMLQNCVGSKQSSYKITKLEFFTT